MLSRDTKLTENYVDKKNHEILNESKKENLKIY